MITWAQGFRVLSLNLISVELNDSRIYQIELLTQYYPLYDMLVRPATANTRSLSAGKAFGN